MRVSSEAQPSRWPSSPVKVIGPCRRISSALGGRKPPNISVPVSTRLPCSSQASAGTGHSLRRDIGSAPSSDSRAATAS